jgi:hypothetical protein
MLMGCVIEQKAAEEAPAAAAAGPTPMAIAGGPPVAASANADLARQQGNGRPLTLRLPHARYPCDCPCDCFSD